MFDHFIAFQCKFLKSNEIWPALCSVLLCSASDLNLQFHIIFKKREGQGDGAAADDNGGGGGVDDDGDDGGGGDGGGVDSGGDDNLGDDDER